MNNCTYNCCIILINLSRNNFLMNEILRSSYFKIDIIRRTPHDVSINTSISTRHNQFHSILHTRQSALKEEPPIYHHYSYRIFCRFFLTHLFNIVTYLFKFYLLLHNLLKIFNHKHTEYHYTNLIVNTTISFKNNQELCTHTET